MPDSFLKFCPNARNSFPLGLQKDIYFPSLYRTFWKTVLSFLSLLIFEYREIFPDSIFTNIQMWSAPGSPQRSSGCPLLFLFFLEPCNKSVCNTHNHGIRQNIHHWSCVLMCGVFCCLYCIVSGPQDQCSTLYSKCLPITIPGNQGLWDMYPHNAMCHCEYQPLPSLLHSFNIY